MTVRLYESPFLMFAINVRAFSFNVPISRHRVRR